MLQFLSNPFTNPSDPWYYVLGILFLALIFGALAAYIIISGKKKKSKPSEEVNNAVSDPAGNDEPAQPEKENISADSEEIPTSDVPEQTE